MLKSFVFSSSQNSVLQQVLCLHVSNYMTQSKAFQWLNVCNGVGYNLYVTLWRIKNQSHSIHYLSFILVVVVVDEAILPNIQTFAKFHTSFLLYNKFKMDIMKKIIFCLKNAIQHLQQLQLLYILEIVHAKSKRIQVTEREREREREREKIKFKLLNGF